MTLFNVFYGLFSWDVRSTACIYIYTTSHVCGVGFVTEREADASTKAEIWVPGSRTESGFMMFSLTLRWRHSVMMWSVGWYRNHNKSFNTELISYYIIGAQKYVKNTPWCVVVCHGDSRWGDWVWQAVTCTHALLHTRCMCMEPH